VKLRGCVVPPYTADLRGSVRHAAGRTSEEHYRGSAAMSASGDAQSISRAGPDHWQEWRLFGRRPKPPAPSASAGWPVRLLGEPVTGQPE
jgi:hypothetical protein